MTVKRLTPLLTTVAGVVSVFLFLNAAHAADTKADTKQADEDKPVVTVNGTVLTNRDLDAFARAVAASRGQQMPREEVLNTLIDRELLYQEAVAKGYDKLPDVVRELDNQRRSLLANVTVNEALRAKPITDQDLRKVYQDVVVGKKLNEYKARHILVKTEGEAKDIIAQLDKGANFSDLAIAKSIDSASAKKGGDLGWFTPNQMVPEFSKAAASLQKGKHTETPVKSQFGWHVIELEDTRPVTPPSFDDIKDRLKGVVQNQRLSEYISSLRQKAKIVNDQ